MHRVVFSIIFISVCVAFPTFRDRIPNGWSVPNPCKGWTGYWQGVGHNILIGTGPRNLFGQDFRAAGFKWTAELCKRDSDTDGRTNGEELGDLNCTWAKGGTPSANATGHPGVCEPMDSAACKKVNEAINCL